LAGEDVPADGGQHQVAADGEGADEQAVADGAHQIGLLDQPDEAGQAGIVRDHGGVRAEDRFPGALEGAQQRHHERADEQHQHGDQQYVPQRRGAALGASPPRGAAEGRAGTGGGGGGAHCSSIWVLKRRLARISQMVSRNSTTEAAEPWPSEPQVLSAMATSRMYMASVEARPPMPPEPLESRNTSENTFMALIAASTATRNIIPLTPGTVTVQKRRTAPAPSISAASWRLLSTFASA